MRKGFEFFTPLAHGSHQGLKDFEKELGFSLPPLYQIFLTSFEHGSNKLKKGVRYVAPNPPRHNGFFMSNTIINVVYDDKIVTEDILDFKIYELIHQ